MSNILFHSNILDLEFKMAAIRHLEIEVERVSCQNLLHNGLRYMYTKGDLCTTI